MELHKAIKEIVASKGAEMICNPQIINYLLDYQAFKEKPATKLILRAIIDSGYAENILALCANNNGWETKFKQYQHEFIDSCGYKEELVAYVFDAMAYGIGLNAIIPESDISELVTDIKNLTIYYEEYRKKCLNYRYKTKLDGEYLRDNFGVLYSSDKKALVNRGNFNEKGYSIRTGTEIISDSAWFNSYTRETEMMELFIPNTVIAIGERSFWTSYIRDLELPSSVIFIGNSAFEFCTFQTIRFHEGLEYIGKDAFRWSIILHEIELPKSVRYIGPNAFPKEVIKSTKSPYISIKDGIVFNQDESLLMSCLTVASEIILPDTLKIIEQEAFVASQMIKIDTGNSLRIIKSKAFYSCHNLREITLSSSLEEIGDYAFANCEQLSSIVIPQNVIYIGSGAFGGCEMLSGIISKSPYFEVVDDALYDIKEKKLIVYFGIDREYEVKKGTKIVGDSAFRNKKSLKKVVLPVTVNLVEFWAFEGCEEIEEVRALNPACVFDDCGIDENIIVKG